VQGKRRQTSWKPAPPELCTPFQVRLLIAIEEKRVGLRSRADLHRKLARILDVKTSAARRLVRDWLRVGAAVPARRHIHALAEMTGIPGQWWENGAGSGGIAEDLEIELEAAGTNGGWLRGLITYNNRLALAKWLALTNADEVGARLVPNSGAESVKPPVTPVEVVEQAQAGKRA
jgi:hypothetical protein